MPSLEELRNMSFEEINERMTRGDFTVDDVVTAIMDEKVSDRYENWEAEVQLPY